MYQACNYEETLPHVCAALSDYARTCATHGILLRGWRNSVDNCSACQGVQAGVGGVQGRNRVPPTSTQHPPRA